MGGINLGLFIIPMNQDIGLNQFFFGLAQTARFIGFAISGFVVGRLLDRFGPRVPLMIVGVLIASLMTGISFVDQSWQLILLFFTMGLIGVQSGGGSLYISVPVAKWFIRNRGKAMSYVFLGIPLGIFLYSPLTQFLIDEIGWRATWAILGIGGGAIITAIGLSVMRRAPEDMGLLPDGETMEVDKTPSKDELGSIEHNWTRRQALRSPTFWRIVCVFGLRMFAMNALGLYRIPFYIARGASAQLVAFALSAEAVSSTVAAVPTGRAMDRFQARYIAAISIGTQISAFLVTFYMDAIWWQVFAATMLFGVGAASSIVVENTLWPQYFGGENVGAIRGVSVPFVTIFSAAGAPIAGAIYYKWATYFPVWWGSVIGLMLAIILILLTPKPLLQNIPNKSDSEDVSTRVRAS